MRLTRLCGQLIFLITSILAERILAFARMRVVAFFQNTVELFKSRLASPKCNSVSWKRYFTPAHCFYAYSCPIYDSVKRQKAILIHAGGLFLSFFLWLMPNHVQAGDFAFDWGGTHNWTAGTIGPTTFTLTDAYGFQIDMRLRIVRIGGTAFAGTPDDLFVFAGNSFGTETSIWLVWDSAANLSGIGESTNTATMEILSGGVPFSSGNLAFKVTDIDAVDNNSASDRCDFITATGNAGNPSLTYVSPTVSTRSVVIGPGIGSGATGAIAANQAQCIYNVGTTTSPSSNGDDNGSILVSYPAGTSVATIAYDESIENVVGANRDASARGVGVWGATLLSVNQTISLAKSTTVTGYSAEGQTISYTYMVTNNGPLPIRTGQNIQIQDDKIGTINCPAIVANIPAGGTHTCTANYTVTAGDMSAASITNNAVAGVGTRTQTFATRLQSNSSQVVVPRRPTITLTKISQGGTGGFTFTGNNGWASETITTSVAGGAGTVGTTQTLGATSVSTTITEAIPAAWMMTGVTCSGTGGGTQPVVNLATGAIAFSAAQMAAGSTITCIVTNELRNPSLTIVKSFSLIKGVGNTGSSAEAGDTIAYTYVVTNNGNQTINNIDIDDSSHTGQGPWVDPVHVGTITADNGTTGDSPDSNGDATIWGTLAPLDVITFTSDYVVTQADIDGQM